MLNSRNSLQTYHNPWTQFIDLDFLNSVFLTISGLHLSYAIIPLAQKSGSISKANSFISSKHSQLMKVQAVFVLINATILSRISDSPLWKQDANRELKNCRNNWRFNLLLFNNYWKINEMCIEPSWLLSAEFYQNVFGFMILGLLVKFPRCKTLIAGFFASISFGGISWVLNQQKMSPVFFTSPE